MNDKGYFERSVSVSASDDIGRRLGGSERRKGDPGGGGGLGKMAESRRKSASFDVKRNRGPDVMAAATISGAASGSGGGGGTAIKSVYLPFE
ncbi:extensin [Anopheles sinensis]|uniref:Extensin n=1 Tax=Anopheles sinensis TaxID=74873 RepID=A0A084W8D4_ANOSI|nr:extensin [Anopheles sinensis]